MPRRIPYALAVHGQEEFDAVAEVLRTHRTIMGENVRRFEARIAAQSGHAHGVMVNSGSSANLLAVQILDLPPGAEAITPVMTFSTTVAPLLQRGIVPVYTDCVEGTYLLDIDQVEASVTERTRLLMVPSLLGNVPDYRRLRAIADRRGLLLLEDSCDTLGATLDGVPTGTYADVSTTSFYGSHIITAAGGGGMLCFHRDDWLRPARVLRGWGRSSAADEREDVDARFGFLLEGEPYDAKFIFERIAYNFLPSEIGAAFGLAQLDRLPAFAASRRRNFAAFLEFFRRYEDLFVLPRQGSGVETAWLAFPLTIRDGAPFTRFELMAFLERNEVQTRPVFAGNLLRHPGFRDAPGRARPEGFPVADRIMRSAFLIGCHQGMEPEDVSRVQALVTAFLEARLGGVSSGVPSPG